MIPVVRVWKAFWVLFLISIIFNDLNTSTQISTASWGKIVLLLILIIFGPRVLEPVIDTLSSPQKPKIRKPEAYGEPIILRVPRFPKNKSKRIPETPSKSPTDADYPQWVWRQMKTPGRQPIEPDEEKPLKTPKTKTPISKKGKPKKLKDWDYYHQKQEYKYPKYGPPENNAPSNNYVHSYPQEINREPSTEPVWRKVPTPSEYLEPKPQPQPEGPFKKSDEELMRLKTMPYREYLETEHWDTVRRRKLFEANYTCERCEIRGVLMDVHHLHYSTRGEEEMEDLLCVCRPCHKIVDKERKEEEREMEEEGL